MDWHFIIGGAVVGFVVGATGVGGGSLMTPLLTLAFGVPAHIAVGTDLLFAAITKAGGAWTHARKGNVNWAIVGWMAAGSVPAAIATLAALHWFGPHPAALAHLMTRTLAIALLLTAGALVFSAPLRAFGRRFAAARPTPAPGAAAHSAPVRPVAALGSARLAGVAALAPISAAGVVGAAGTVGADLTLPATGAGPSFDRTEPTLARPVPTLIVGLIIGALVTLSSVGAGVLGVTALLVLYPLLPTRRIVGVDIAHAVPLTLVAGIGHAALGSVDWSLLGALLIGSLPAIFLGAQVAHRLPERLLRIALATMLVIIGSKFLFF